MFCVWSCDIYVGFSSALQCLSVDMRIDWVGMVLSGRFSGCSEVKSDLSVLFMLDGCFIVLLFFVSVA